MTAHGQGGLRTVSSGHAPHEFHGVVAEILKQAGDSFDKDAVVVRLAPLEEEA